MTKFTAL